MLEFRIRARARDYRVGNCWRPPAVGVDGTGRGVNDSRPWGVQVGVLMTPHGGRLVSLCVQRDRAAELRAAAGAWPSWQLTPRQTFDLELLATGGFSPLQTFLGHDDYVSVCESMRLSDGTLWPMPVTLDVPDHVVASAEESGSLALRDSAADLIAVLHVEESWRPDRETEAKLVFGTTDPAHPSVDHLLRRTHSWYVSGKLEVVRLPEHGDFPQLRHTPSQLREEFSRRGWHRIVAFNTRNPMHRAHQELTLRAAVEANAKLLIHPVVGLTKPGDVDRSTRVRCYQAILPSYPQGDAMLSLLPLAMRMGGPREALWHSIIRKNYGASHFIVGRDHAGPSPDANGRPFYQPYDAQALVRRHEAELGVTVMTFRQLVYLEDSQTYVPDHDVPPGARTRSVSGTQLRRLLADGRDIPEWFTPAAVVAELRRAYPARSDQGAAASAPV
jgi:sulfate adenylyltransferase